MVTDVFRRFLATLGMMMALLPLCCHAQTRVTIIDELLRNGYSGGTIYVECDSKIKALIGEPLMGLNSSNEVSVKLPGFRIQAFSGSQQGDRSVAEAKAREIRSLFPDISINVTFKSPVWQLRIGDFQTSGEATNFMKDFKKKYPALGREMYVVSDEIKVVF
ncbi:MAG: SPOR domain-containing protein [Dysgonamonadaceae bacterium]|nr:SPOR domain-containing protein [Dysgonamonadaceae bacterium]